MKKLTVMCVIGLLFGTGTALAQPTYQFAEAGTKNFISETTIDVGDQISLDLYLSNVPIGLGQSAGGAWIDFTASTGQISYVSGERCMWDGSGGCTGPWAPGAGVFINEPDMGYGPVQGLVLYIVANLAVPFALPDGEGDLIVGTLTLQCDGPGDAIVNLSVVPGMGTWSSIDDATVVPAILLIHQVSTCIQDSDCDDLQFCNGVETCDLGTNLCVAGTPPDCSDLVGCTDDYCDEVNDVCVNNPNDGNCDDGLFCNGAEFCDVENDCFSIGNPCPAETECDEENDVCLIDTDLDGIPDDQDNCPNHPNGPFLGTCLYGNIGETCTNNEACGASGFCSMNQEDNYPPGGNDIGDACECEGDLDRDGDVDADDVTKFLEDFGRNQFNNPCP